MLGASRGVAAVRGGVARLRQSRAAVVVLVYAALVLDNMLLTVVVPIIPEYLYQLEHRHVPVSLNTTTIATPSSFVTTFSSPDASSSFLERDENLTPQSLKAASRRTLTPAHKTQVREPVASIQPSSPRLSLRVDSKGDQTKSLRELNDNEKRATVDISDFKILQLPRWYRRLRSKRAFRQIDGALVGGERRMLDEYFQELPTKHKTQSQQIASENNMSRFARNEQILDGSSLEFLTTKKRVLLSPRRHRTSEAPPTSKEPKQTNKTKDSKPTKPTASVSGLAVREREMYKDINDENWKVGMLLSSKALVQLMVNPMVGSLTAHIGYSLPLVFGTHNLLLSAVLFASAQDFILMFLARSLQGVASACIAVSGMGIIAELFTDDGERGRVQGLVMGGIALGVLTGYPLGSLLYDFMDSKTPPFLVVAVLTVVLGIVQVVVLNPRKVPERMVTVTPLSQLVQDPYIVVTAGAVMVATSTLAVLEPCLPIWLIDNLHLQKWQLGVVFIPDSVGYFLGTSCTAGPSYTLGRWRAALLAMMLVALAAATVPEATSLFALSGPHLFLGMGVGTVDAALMPLLAALVDTRHVGAYGAVYSIAQAAVALAYFLGPLVGSAMVEVIGFPWLMRSMAFLNLCYCPLLCFLGAHETTTASASETQAILMAAPQPNDYLSHITTVVQPNRQSSVTYHQLFDEDDDD
ncbi:synaptic vesicular amine transporter-like isoform X1 [Scylla paramamosain]|uniref:synaptic vesicular amine transporter-like isoform X1 n=1 Tax=Scylla paramamosain TaxID=85552 RepID=UPI003082A527